MDIRSVAVHSTVQKFGEAIRNNPEAIHQADANGWTVLHEAARTGRLEIVKLILEHGVDKDLMTKAGETPLNLARRFLEEDHELIEYLENIGAKNISPARANRRHQEL